MKPSSRALGPLLVLSLFLVAAPPSTAAACDPMCEVVGIGIGITLVGLADLAVLGMDLSHAVRGRWLPTDLAWGNVAYGGAHLVAGTLLVALERDDFWVGLGSYGLVAGALMVLEGALSLALYEEDEAPLGLSAAPTSGGGMVALQGAW
jgi:hypothetical protein